MKVIPLNKSLFTLVDDEDFEWLTESHWYAEKPNVKSLTWYVQRTIKKKHERMHRLIMKAPKGIEVDHIDGNGLNNQKSNLRFATRAQNMCNIYRCGSSGYKGVWERKDGRKRRWQSMIGGGKLRRHLGDFYTAEEAAAAYNVAAIELYGEFANLNYV